LIIAAIALSLLAYYVTAKAQHNEFLSNYDGYATKIIDAYLEDSELRLWTAESLSADVTADFVASQAWPFVTMTNFSRRVVGLGYIAKANSILFAPLVTNETRAQWEQYAVKNQYLVHNNISSTNQTSVDVDGALTAMRATLSEEEELESIEAACGDSFVPMYVEDGILAYAGKCGKAAAKDPGPFFPIWEMAPWHARHFMMDLMSFDFLKDQLHAAIEKQQPQISMTIIPTGSVAYPFCCLLFPVFGGFSADAPVVGMISLAFQWIAFFRNILPVNAVGLQLVLRNTCGQAYTFELNGPDVAFIGDTDSHDTKYDDLVFECEFKPTCRLSGSDLYRGTAVQYSESNDTQKTCSNSAAEADELHSCKYSIRVYPTDNLRDTFTSSNPVIYATSIALIFVFTAIVFLAYDYLVERRQRVIAKTAARSNAIVHALYPARFRDRVYRDSQNNDVVPHQPTRTRRISERINPNGMMGPVEALQSINSSVQGRRDDESFGKLGRLAMLPETPKLRLKSYLFDTPTVVSSDDFESEPIAEMFTDTTIMFADISGFTAWSSEREPSQVFILLETLYRAFDAVAHRLGVFKVETIGDCYVAVVGLPDPNEHHAVVMTYFGYECIRQMKELVRELEATLGPGTSDLCMRVGLHSGPVTAGVLRGEKSRFQLFGDSVNTAARMESTGEPNLIHASQDTADLLVASGKVSWVAARDDVVSVKGKGPMQTFWLKPRRGSAVSYTYLMDNSSCASSTIDSKPKHRAVTPHRTLIQKHSSSRVGNESSSAGSASSPMAHGQVDFNKWGNLSLDEVLTAKASAGNQKKASQKISRLVDWNVDLLLSFLSKVVANRDGPTAITRLRQSIDINNLRSERSTKILSEVTEVILFPDYDNAKRLRSQTDVVLPPEVREQLHDYVSRIATMYRDIPFHNLEHASHVTMSAVKLMRRIINPDDVDGDPRDVMKQEEKSVKDVPAKQLDECFYRNLHESTFGISSDPLTQFCLVFAALVHVSTDAKSVLYHPSVDELIIL
jgi:class 3 adenylate cyclase